MAKIFSNVKGSSSEKVFLRIRELHVLAYITQVSKLDYFKQVLKLIIEKFWEGRQVLQLSSPLSGMSKAAGFILEFTWPWYNFSTKNEKSAEIAHISIL